jgi:hypothetical protein
MKQKIAELINVIFGFRKFLLMLVIVIIGVVFRLKGLVDGAELVDLLKTTTLGFFGANGIEHVVNCIKDNNATKIALQGGAPAEDDVIPSSEQEADDAVAEASASEKK